MLSAQALRRLVLPITLALASSAQSTVSNGTPPVNKPPAHLTLEYNIEWRLINAGTARLDLSASPVLKDGWESKLHLESTGLVSRLFHVNDDYTSEMNNSFCSTGTYMTAREGSRSRDTKVTFDANNKRAEFYEKDLKTNAVDRRETDIPACVHDIISALFLLRTMDLEPGKTSQIPVSNGKKTVYLKIASQRREDVRVPAGGMQKAIRYEVFAFDNQLYNRPGHLHVWLTDDNRRIPLQVEIRLQFVIGTVTLRLGKETQS
jgi:hypothetical protein